jgi:Uma2 family endonuclease
MGMAITSSLPPDEAETTDLYEIVDGQRVWPRVGEPETDALYEIVDGERREIPRLGALAATVATLLATHLNVFALPRKLGFAVVEAMFQLQAGRPQRRPDVAFVAMDRWRASHPPADNDPPAWDVVPAVAVEVISPTNTADDIEKKLQDYFAAGVGLVWVVYPVLQRVYVYTSLTDIRIVTATDALDGGTVLPGFRLPLGDLFAALAMP